MCVCTGKAGCVAGVGGCLPGRSSGQQQLEKFHTMDTVGGFFLFSDNSSPKRWRTGHGGQNGGCLHWLAHFALGQRGEVSSKQLGTISIGQTKGQSNDFGRLKSRRRIPMIAEVVAPTSLAAGAARNV